MTDINIKPEDVSPQEAQNVLNFLNNAKSAVEIAEAVEIPGERDVGIRVAQRILDRRGELGGFTNLRQVADVPQVGPERFTEIVITLRYKIGGGGKMPLPPQGYLKILWYRVVFLGSETQDVRIFFRGREYRDNKIKDHRVIVNFRENEPLPPGTVEELTYRPGIYIFNTYYLRSSYSDIIDILRNEGSTLFRYQADGIYTIETGAEEVGEGEI